MTASPPAGVTLVITGNGTTTTIVGQSPALTVTSGKVIVTGVALSTATDAPTILVTGGSLTLRNDDIIQASTAFTDPAIAVTGGTVNLGTATAPGNNTLSVGKSGDLVSNSTGNPISAVGDTFEVGGTVETAPSLSFTALTSSAATAVLNQPVKLTATVDANGSSVTPTGSVDFLDTTAGTDLGSVLLSGGVATLTTSTLTPGNHLIVAKYSGDTNYLPSAITIAESVQYGFSGFLPPLSNGLSFAANRTIPIKFTLTDYNGNAITSLGAVTSLRVAPVVNGVAGRPFALASTNGQGLQSSGGQYLFTWQTKGLAAGTYQVQLTLADGTVQTKTLQLTANGSGANAQAADGGDVSEGGTGGQLLGGDLEVYVDNSNGELTPDELARIQDAISAVDAVTAPYGVTVAETTGPSQAEVTLDMASTSPVGGYAEGILGCFDPAAGQITLLQGWDWYAGSDPTQVGAGQYDLQTTVTHELGHALGLGESNDPTSAMYGTLAPGTAVRTLTTADLNVPYDESGANAQRAAPIPSPVAGTNAIAAQTVAPGGLVVVGVPAMKLLSAVSVHDVTSVPSKAIRLAQADGSVTTMQPDAGHTALTAGIAPAGLPATAAVAEGSLQAVTVAVLARGKQLTVPDIGGAGAVIDSTGSVILSDVDLGKGTAAVDAFFSARLPEGGTRPHADTCGSSRMPAALGDLAWALGLEGGKDTGAVAGPVVGNLAAGSPVLFALLGATWGAQAEEREARLRRRRRQG
jgi:hypothetical protein